MSFFYRLVGNINNRGGGRERGREGERERERDTDREVAAVPVSRGSEKL